MGKGNVHCDKARLMSVLCSRRSLLCTINRREYLIENESSQLTPCARSQLYA